MFKWLTLMVVSWEYITTYFWLVATATELRWDGFLNTNRNIDTGSLTIELILFSLIDAVFIAAKRAVPSSVKRLIDLARLHMCIACLKCMSCILLHKPTYTWR